MYTEAHRFQPIVYHAKEQLKGRRMALLYSTFRREVILYRSTKNELNFGKNA